MKTFITAIIFLMAGNCFAQAYHNGDIVFIKLKALAGKNILPNGNSRFDYAGIVFIDNGSPIVYYATEPFSKTAFNNFIALSENKAFEVKRLADKNLLTGSIVQLMREYAIVELGSAYDNDLKLNNDALYNAEFIWKIYQLGTGLSLCIPREIKDYKNDSSALELLKDAYGEKMLDEKIVTVGDIYQSQFLE